MTNNNWLDVLIKNLAQHKKISQKKQKETKSLAKNTKSLYDVWRAVVGDSLSQYCVIVAVKHHICTIQVVHPSFGQLIYMYKEDIITSLNNEYPQWNVKDIRITVVDEFKVEVLQAIIK